MAFFAGIRAVFIFAPALAGLALAGCSGGEAPQTADGRAVERADFQAVAAQYEDVAPYFPDHPKSRDFVDRLVEEAMRETGPSTETATLLVMDRFRDDKIGIYLFNGQFEPVDAMTAEEKASYCREIQQKFPGSALHVAAVDKELNALWVPGKPEAFLARCEELERSTPFAPALGPVYRMRADYHLVKQNHLRASVDFLRLCRANPDDLFVQGLKYDAYDSLTAAGLILELYALDLSETQGKDFDDAIGMIVGSAEARLEQAGTSASLASLLAVCDDGQTTLEQKIALIGTLTTSTTERIIDLARLACKRGRAHAIDEAVQAYGALTGTLEPWVNEAGIEKDEAARRLKFAFFLHETMELCGQAHYDHMATEWLFGKAVRPGLLAREPMVAQAYQAQAQELDRLFAQGVETKDPALARQSADHLVAVRKKTKDEAGIEAAYRSIPTAFPDDGAAPEYLMKLADYHRQETKNREKSIAIYQEITKKYPSSPQFPMARLYLGIEQYEAGKTQAALAQMNAIMADETNQNIVAVSKFYSARCHADLKNGAEVERLVNDLVNNHSSNDVAPQALYWYAVNQLTTQQYEGARASLTKLTNLYPNSKQQHQAADILVKLNSMQTRESGRKQP